MAAHAFAASYGQAITGEIIYCDVYGNLVSNIPAAMLGGGEIAEVRIRGRVIRRLSSTFLDAAEGRSPAALVALFGSHGYLEVAVPNGSAASMLNSGVGERLTVAFPGT